ncbi:MAG: dihydrodipicolinate synthase family protein, partial [Paracoccaceae bacterium]
FDGFEAFSGTETAILDNLRTGGSGCISATTNITAPLVARAVKSGDATEARRLLALATQMRDLIGALGMVSGTKAAISACRADPEWLRCLPPNMAVSAEAASALHAALQVIWAQGAPR